MTFSAWPGFRHCHRMGSSERNTETYAHEGSLLGNLLWVITPVGSQASKGKSWCISVFQSCRPQWFSSNSSQEFSIKGNISCFLFLKDDLNHCI